MRRRNVPCSPCSGGSSSGDCCGLKEKLRILWDRTIGSILRINGISPDGDGDFTIEAGDNIQLTERGTGNGIRIDTTGGVSYYSAGDVYVDVDNNDLEISLVNPGASGGVALHDDLALVADAVSDILDGTSTVPKATDATNAEYLGDSTSNVGTDTKPIKIVNGQAVPVTDNLLKGVIGQTAIDNIVSGQNYQNTTGKLCLLTIRARGTGSDGYVNLEVAPNTSYNYYFISTYARPNYYASLACLIAKDFYYRITYSNLSECIVYLQTIE